MTCKRCLGSKLSLKSVVFKNNSKHVEATCQQCGLKFYVPRNSGQLILNRQNLHKQKPKKRVWVHTPLKKSSRESSWRTPSKLEIAKNKAAEARKEKFKNSNPFYRSIAWRILRAQVLCVYKKCCICNSELGLQVDHIKPRSKYPELALDINNLQVLCEPCNMSKSDRDDTDHKRVEVMRTNATH